MRGVVCAFLAARKVLFQSKYGTTEKAIESMNILGLRRGNELVDKLCLYMEKILNERGYIPRRLRRKKLFE